MEWTPTEFESHPSLDFVNRYFSSRKHVKTEGHIPFDAKVDPQGILARLRDDEFIHTTDNTVRYFELIEEKSDKLKCVIQSESYNDVLY